MRANAELQLAVITPESVAHSESSLQTGQVHPSPQWARHLSPSLLQTVDLERLLLIAPPSFEGQCL